MRMTLTDLRAATRDWLDDPHGAAFGEARLDRLINEAYQHVINEIDRIPQPWSMHAEADAATITTVASTREYRVGQARNILEVTEVLSGGKDSPPITQVPFWDRNSAAEGVYLYRSRTDGDFYLGLVIFDSPQYDSLRVFYLPGDVTKLTSSTQSPFEIPDEYHELVSLWAAVLGKFQENREAGGLTQAYALKFDQLTTRKAIGAPHRKRRIVS